MKRLIFTAAAALMLTACGNTSKVDSILAGESSKAQDSSSQSDVSLNAVDSAVIAEAEQAHVLDSSCH